LAGGAMLVMALTATPASRLQRALRGPWLRSWGKYSYGIYIVHLPLLGAIAYKSHFYEQGVALLGGSRLPSVLLLAATGTSAAYVLGWMSYHLYEKRFLALKRYFAPDPRPAARPSAPLAHRGADDPRPVRRAMPSSEGRVPG
ncbi:MAG TPA: hypothetical protein VEU74_08825, partial [Gemmatimonadales bacterium]|nr:hypothetical protein [Gemmatimonadales bacterium]